VLITAPPHTHKDHEKQLSWTPVQRNEQHFVYGDSLNVNDNSVSAAAEVHKLHYTSYITHKISLYRSYCIYWDKDIFIIHHLKLWGVGGEGVTLHLHTKLNIFYTSILQEMEDGTVRL
jgi:hypothetical protein